MIYELLERSYVLSELAKRSTKLREFADLVEQEQTKALEAATKLGLTANNIREAATLLDEAVARENHLAPSTADEHGAYIPSEPLICAWQGWAEQTAEQLGAIGTDLQSQGLAHETTPITRRHLRRPADQPEQQGLIGDMVDGSDLRYFSDAALAKTVTAVRGKRPFNPRAAAWPMQPNPRLVLVGDWGSGVERAQNLGRVMRAELDGLRGLREQHMIHLGDVYYTGQGWEYEKRFLRWWPVRPEDAQAFASWSLNGNHDMYSGGHGFFDTLLADDRFAEQRSAEKPPESPQPTSFFLLENEYWQVFGLDSAWQAPDFSGMNGDLFAGQAAWMKTARDRAPEKGCLVLTHHQLFSARPGEGSSPMIELQLRRLGLFEQIDAWIWGHEHRCVVYERGEAGIPFSCCLGNGGVPVRVEAPGNALKPSVAWEYQETIKEGLFHPRHYARFGYAILDFQGAAIDLRIYGEDGHQKWPVGQGNEGIIRKRS